MIALVVREVGVGELGLCGVGAAIANAIYNATGVRVRDYPITQEKQWIPIYITNRSEEVFRHPEPIEPRSVVITWKSRKGGIVGEGRSKAFLPLALGPGEEIGRGIQVEVPVLPPGAYQVVVSFEDRPDTPLGRTRVRLQPGAGLALPGAP